VSFWVGLVLAAAGLLVVARRGRPWICTIAFVTAVLLAVLFRIDENGVHTSTEGGTTVGVGLWLVGIAAVIGAATALTGFAVRRRR
jgi:hypothetical protein